MKNLITLTKNGIHSQVRKFNRFDKRKESRHHLFSRVHSRWSIGMLFLFLAVPIFSIVAQNQKAIRPELQEDKAFLKSQLAGSRSTVKPAVMVPKKRITLANDNAPAQSKTSRILSDQEDILISKKPLLRANKFFKTPSSLQNFTTPEKQVRTLASILWDDQLINDDGTSNGVHEYPSAAVDGNGNYVVAWDDYRLGTSNVYLQWFSANGTAYGSNSKVNNDVGMVDHYSASVAANAKGNTVVGWVNSSSSNVYLQRFDVNRLPVGANIQVNDYSKSGYATIHSVAVAMDYGGNIYVAWRDGRRSTTDIYFQRFTANGVPLGSNIKVNDDPGTASNVNHYWPSIAVDSSGDCTIVWYDYRKGDGDIFLQRFNASGTAQGSNIRVNDDTSTKNQRYPSVAMDRYGNSTIAWSDSRNGDYDIYLQCYDANGYTVGFNTLVNDDSGTTDQYFPSVSMNTTGFTVVAWVDYRNNSPDLYLQQYSSGGIAWASNVKVNDNASGTVDVVPAAIIDKDFRYVIVWPDYRNGNDEIYMQRYDANDNPQGSNSKVNDDVGTASQYAPSVGIDGNGTSTIVWEDERNPLGIYLQRINSSGIIQGYNIKVNDASSGVYYPAISVNSSGSSVVAWQDNRNGGYDIYLQRFNSSGVVQGANVRVTDTSSALTIFNNEVSVAIDKSGNSVVAWADMRNGNEDIYLQRFDASGVAQGKNVKVNDDAGTTVQEQPSVAIDGSGNCIVAWMDNRNSNYDIYLQRYSASGIAQGSNVKVNNDVSTADQLSPCVAVTSAGNSAIAWEDYQSGVGDIYLQRFDASGVTQGTNVKVNDDVGTNGQYWPTVAFDGSGNCIVAWQDYRYGSNNPDVLGQLYTASGTASQGNFRIVKDGPNQIEIVPKLVATGQTVVCTWQDNRRAKGYDIYAKSFSSDWKGLANPPVAPQNLTAAAGKGQVTLKWNKNTEANFLRYRIYKGITSLGETLSDSTSAGIIDTTRVITGLINGTTYYFRVTAVDNLGLESGYSNEVGTMPNNGPVISHTPPSVVIVVNNGTASQPVSISASATDANGISTMDLQYQQVGQPTIYPIPFTSPFDGTQPVSIPANIFVYNNQAIGVNYRIVATNTLPISSSTQWYSINVRNGSGTSIQPTFTFPVATNFPNDFSKAYFIFSIPYDLDDKSPSGLFPNNFGDHSQNGTSYFNWRLQRVNNGIYQDYEDFKDDVQALAPGSAFFLIIRNQKTLMLGANKVANADVMYNTGVQLSGGMNGWYLLGTPLNMSIPWNSLVFLGATPIDHAFYTGTGAFSGWDKTATYADTLRPWQGIAVKTTGNCTVKFQTLSPQLNIHEDQGLTPAMLAASIPKIEASPYDWKITVDAYRSDIDMRCEGGGFGMHNGADIDHDQFDSYEPPIVGDKTVAFGFAGPNGPRLCDIRPLSEEGGVWNMQLVTVDAGAKVKLQFGDVTKLPNPAFEAYLIDLDKKIAYNLKEVSTLEVNSGNGVRNFNVVVGKHSYVEQNNAGVALEPTTMRLYANYPNPFNPETVIRYEVPNTSKSYHVALKVFNMLGQEVATLVNEQQKSGYYEARWDARRQSSSVYFYQISVTDGVQSFKDTKKMVLLK